MVVAGTDPAMVIRSFSEAIAEPGGALLRLPSSQENPYTQAGDPRQNVKASHHPEPVVLSGRNTEIHR